MASAATHLAPVSLELGGKGANIVFADADLDNAVYWAVEAIFRNAGQICLAGSRLFVHSSIYDEFMGDSLPRPRRSPSVTPSTRPPGSRRWRASGTSTRSSPTSRAREAGGRSAPAGSPTTAPGWCARRSSTGCRWTPRRTARRSSARSASSTPSTPRTRSSTSPTTPGTASTRCSSPRTSRAPTGSPQAAGRHGLGQLLLHPRSAHPLRRRRRLRRRARGRQLQPRVLHRAQGRRHADRDGGTQAQGSDRGRDRSSAGTLDSPAARHQRRPAGCPDPPGTKVRGEGDAATDDIARSPRPTTGSATPGSSGDRIRAQQPRRQGAAHSSRAVHFGREGYDNAFWDGTQMVFGDGDGDLFLAASPRSLDVIGHELAHGVTQYTSGLNYQDQSGALNESVSDVFGVLVKQRLLGQTADQADWLIGAELLGAGEREGSGAAVDGRPPERPTTTRRSARTRSRAHDDDYVDTRRRQRRRPHQLRHPQQGLLRRGHDPRRQRWEAAGARSGIDPITGDISADCDFETFAALTVKAATARHGARSEVVAAVRAGWVAVGLADASPRLARTPHRPGVARAPPPRRPARRSRPARPNPHHRSRPRARRSTSAAPEDSPGAPWSARSPSVSCRRQTPRRGGPCWPMTICRRSRTGPPAAPGCPTASVTACGAMPRRSTSSCPSRTSATRYAPCSSAPWLGTDHQRRRPRDAPAYDRRHERARPAHPAPR
jgi:hypothetical protein